MKRPFCLLACACAALMLGVCAGAEDTADARAQLATMRLEPTVDRLVQYAAQGDMAVVQLLLQAGIHVADAEPRRRVTALHNAAAQGHLKLVRFLLDRGAPVDAEDWRGTTPLVAAAFYGHAETARVLIEHGARVDVVPAQAPTPLVAAVYSGSLQAVEVLVRAHASEEQTDWSGNDALSVAERAGRTDILARLRASQAAAP